jgi:hypothetical protein
MKPLRASPGFAKHRKLLGDVRFGTQSPIHQPTPVFASSRIAIGTAPSWQRHISKHDVAIGADSKRHVLFPMTLLTGTVCSLWGISQSGDFLGDALVALFRTPERSSCSITPRKRPACMAHSIAWIPLSPS